MMFSKNGVADSDKRYIESYGEVQFFKDLDTYGALKGMDWGDIIAEEQPVSMEAFHKQVLGAIRAARSARTAKTFGQIQAGA